jgi:hypothetical protein
LLAKRLVGRGVVLPGGTLTTALAANEISASVPVSLVSSTIKAALLAATGQAIAETVVSANVVALTGEVMKAMLFSKLKSAAVVLFVCMIGGFGWLSYGSLAEQPDDTGRLDQKKPVATVRAANEGLDAQEKASAPEPEIANVDPYKDRTNSRELIARFRDMVDAMLFNQQPMTLREFLGLMYDVFAKKGKALPVMVDAAAFREENPKAESILEAQIQFQPFPRQATVANMLSQALSQLPERNAAVLVRDGVVIITTQKRAGLAHLLREKLSATFDNSPLPEVLQDISEMTGVSIILDPRGVESKTRISAAFLNDVTLGAAIRIIADLAGLKVVNMHSGLYLTTPDNAKELEKELREAKE